jgi:SAM-dependent methyltransferase
MSNEASKAATRRALDPAFTDLFFVGDGIDIGAGPDGLGKHKDKFPRMRSVRDWDLPDGDAMLMASVEDNTFDFVHSSHCLEHLHNPATSLGSWLRIVKPGGFVIVTIPDEDLYEQGVFPSTFNPDHKVTFTTWKPHSWSPRSVSLIALLPTLNPPCQIVKVEQLLAKYEWAGQRRDLTMMSDAECAIELVLRKPEEGELEAGGRMRRPSLIEVVR